MNWFRQNRWLGTFLIVFGILFLAGVYFLYSAKTSYDEAYARFNETASERSRLERLDPFPSEANYKKTKGYAEKYATALDELKADLKNRVPAAVPLAPNEFQSRLRQSMIAVADKARANKVQLPENFALGFDEYTAGLPTTGAAPLLGQELSQIESLLNILIEAHVDNVSTFTRTRLPEEGGGSPTPTPIGPGARKPPTPPAGSAPKQLDRNVVDFTFASAPSAARKVLNQIVSANQQFYVTRLLHVHNEKEKGPPREQPSPAAGAVPTATPAATPAKPATNAAITFIVGNEHIETSLRIEMIRFTF